MENLKKFHLLDEKIEQIVRKISNLRDNYQALRIENKNLLEENYALREQNRELSKQLEELMYNKGRIAGTTIDKEEIRKRIDRVLEKFGELQL